MSNSKINALDSEEILKYLISKKNEFVNVCIQHDVNKPNGLYYGMQISGILEKHPEEAAFRVLVNENSYAFFNASHVVMIAEAKNKSVDNDKKLVIMISYAEVHKVEKLAVCKN